MRSTKTEGIPSNRGGESHRILLEEAEREGTISLDELIAEIGL